MNNAQSFCVWEESFGQPWPLLGWWYIQHLLIWLIEYGCRSSATKWLGHNKICSLILHYHVTQVGLLTEYPHGVSVASAVLISARRVLTAAHNINDAVLHVTRINVILGSVTIFTGGTRLVSTSFVLHENWAPPVRNDIAIINLPHNVGFTSK